MACIFDEIYLTEQEFTDQFESIIDSIDEHTKTVWIIDHKVALIPYGLYGKLSAISLDIDIESITDGAEFPEA